MTFYYKEQGRGEPVLLLHGFTGSHATWAHTLPLDLYHCVQPDLAGHGRTSRLPGLIEEEAAALKQLMDNCGFASFHLAGYSMGGRLALVLALLYPDSVRSLVLESASPGLREKQEQQKRRQADEALAQQIKQNGLPAFVDYWEGMPMFASQKQLDRVVQNHIRAERLSHTAEGLAASLRMMGTGSQPSYWGRLHQLKMPVLLLTGTEDAKFTGIARRMKDLIPFAEWRQCSGAGHAIHVEQRKKFGTIVETFLTNQKEGH